MARRGVFMLVAFLAFSLCARADVFRPESGARKKTSLNGDWKYSIKDSAAYSKPNYNDASWHTIRVPGDVTAEGVRGARVMWFRKKFTLPSDKRFSHVRFARVLDSAEVWLNGEKLTFPQYPARLDERQAGTFARIWTFEWPDAFDISAAALPGRENVLAVRVVNDPATQTDVFAAHPDITARNAAGILGDVSLVQRPDVFVSAFTREHPKKISNGRMRHKFFVFISNDSPDARDLKVEISIFDDTGGGRRMFSKTEQSRVSGSGEIIEFKWNAAPTFHTMRAVATIRENGALRDSVALTFHGTVVSAGGGRLTVNGDPFTIRGAHGTPGLLAAGRSVKKNTLTDNGSDRDLDMLRDAGVSVVHTSHPTVPLMQKAARYGIMVIPVITPKTYENTLLALKEFSNILFWEISASQTESVYLMAATIAAVDPYRRPISYAGPLRLAPGSRASEHIDIRAVTAVHEKTAVCSAYTEYDDEYLYYLYPWGVKADAELPGAGYQMFDALRRSWESCAARKQIQGAVYRSLSSSDPRLPGLRHSQEFTRNPDMIAALAYVFAELRADITRTDTGRYVMSVQSGSACPLRGLSVTVDGRGAGSRDTLASGATAQFNTGGASPSRAVISFASHYGLARSVKLDLTDPMLDPPAIRFSKSAIVFKKAQTAKLTLTITAPDNETIQGRITITADNKSLQIEPAARNITVRAGDTATAPFNVLTPGAAARDIRVTARLDFKNERRHPRKAQLAVSVR